MENESFTYQLIENWETINGVGNLSIGEKVALKWVSEK